MSKYSEFIRLIDEGKQRGWRTGQSVFNALCEVDSDLAEEIRMSNKDPYYHDERSVMVMDLFVMKHGFD